MALYAVPTMNHAALSSFYRDRRVCVTGGAGFIGSHLVDALLALGSRVAVIDDLSSGRLENLASHQHSINFTRASILDEPALHRAIASDAAGGSGGGARPVEVLFHQAAITSVPRSVEEPLLYHEVNALGTLRVLEAARNAGVKRVVFASSSSAYGDQTSGAKIESMSPQPRSPYAAAKCAGEHFMHAWAHCFNLSTVSLRYFNIFGQRQRPDSPYAAVIPRLVDALMHSRTPIIFGDGSQTRDFTHVSNAVHANLLAGACDHPLRGEVINIAAGEGATVLELLHRIAAILGVEARFESRPPRPGEIQHSRADIAKARRLLGYQPVTTFAAGLEQTVHWYRDTLA
jgi:UDP-glucose 4-epimerase